MEVKINFFSGETRGAQNLRFNILELGCTKSLVKIHLFSPQKTVP